MKKLFIVGLFLFGLVFSASAQTRPHKKSKTGRAKPKAVVTQTSSTPSSGLGSGIGSGTGNGIGIGTGSGIGTGTGTGIGNGAANGRSIGRGDGSGVGNQTRTSVSADLTPLIILDKPAPELTGDQKQSGVSGVVRLRVTFAASGQIGNIAVISGLPGGLTESAIKAARQIKFQPARKNNQLITQTKIVEYSFNQN